MISAQCPRCAEKVRLAATDLPDDTYAQCPWCRETFPASELMDSLPPLVQLLDASGEPLELHTQPIVGFGDQNPFAEETESHESGLAGLVGGASAGVAGVAMAGAAAIGLNDTVSAEDIDESSGTVISDTWQDEGTIVEDDRSDAAEASPSVEEQYFDELKIETPEEVTPDVGMGKVDVKPPTQKFGYREDKPLRRKKKSSPLRMMLSMALGPILAVPIVGGILLAWGKAPDLGFYPFDGSFNKQSQGGRKASPPGPLADTQRSQKVPVGKSLLDENSDVGKAVRDMQEDVTANVDQPVSSDADNTAVNHFEPKPKPSQITDLHSVPISLPGASQDPPVEKTAELVPPGEAYQEIPVPKSVEDTTAKIENAPPQGDDTTNNADIAANPNSFAVNNTDAAVNVPSEDSSVSDPPSMTASTNFDLPKVEESGRVEPKIQIPQELSKPDDSPELIAATEKAADAVMTLFKLKRDGKATDKDVALTYRTVAAVGVETADPKSPAVEKLVNGIVKSSQLADYSKITPEWLKYPRRQHDGVVLSGAFIEGANTSIRLESGKEVIVRLADGVSFPSSTSVVGIGKIDKLTGIVDLSHLKSIK